MLWSSLRRAVTPSGPVRPTDGPKAPKPGCPYISKNHGRPQRVGLGPNAAPLVAVRIVPERNAPLSKGNREVRKPKAIKPKVIAAAPSTLSQTLAPRKK